MEAPKVRYGRPGAVPRLVLRAWPQLASVALILAVSYALAGWGLAAVNGRSLFAQLAPGLAALSFPLVGVLIARRMPANPIGWILCAIGLSEAIALAADQYAWRALIARPGSLPFGEEVAWVASWIWIPGMALLSTFLLLLFPNGRLPSRRWRPVVLLASALLALMGVAIGLTWPHRGAWMLRPDSAAPELGWIDMLGGTAFLGFVAACVPASVASLVVRFRRSRRAEREQMKWFAYAASLTALVFLVREVVPGSPWTEILGIPMVLLIPAGVGAAVLKHRLYDIDIVINRSIVYGFLTAGVVGLYVTTVALLGQFFERTDPGVSLVAAGTVAVVFHPLRERLQRSVDRLMFGERDDPYGVLSALVRRLESVGIAEQALPAVTDSVARALRLPYVGIDLSAGGEFRTAASSGEPVPGLRRWPLVHQGETIGHLVVSPRGPGEEFSEGDVQLLDDVARQTSVAAYAVALTEDLRRSREQLRTALEEERRRIRRDLHDGLGPSLATVVVGLEEARNRYSLDPRAADALLEDLKQQTQAAITDIRALVYDLRPAALDELGLVQAIRELALRLAGRADRSGGLAVAVDAPDGMPFLPAAVEVAAFRVVQEALTNVVKHARASNCRIRVSVDDELVVEVSDNGVGIPRGYHPGVGIRSMRERATELGGSLTVSSQSSGTQVAVRFPLERA
jgi:signal transduction histidine kinase